MPKTVSSRYLQCVEADPSGGIPDELREQALYDWQPGRTYGDGEIFCHLRECARQSRLDSAQFRRWKSLLTATKLRDYRYLTRRECLKPLLDALDTLTRYEGLWEQFHLGAAHRWFLMRCYEVSAGHI